MLKPLVWAKSSPGFEHAELCALAAQGMMIRIETLEVRNLIQGSLEKLTDCFIIYLHRPFKRACWCRTIGY